MKEIKSLEQTENLPFIILSPALKKSGKKDLQALDIEVPRVFMEARIQNHEIGENLKMRITEMFFRSFDLFTLNKETIKIWQGLGNE